MPGPYNKTCNCRCLPPFPCIEGCAKSGDFTYETVRVNMVSPTYSYTTASDSFRYNTGDAVVHIFNPDVTAIGTYKDLQRRPNSAAFGYGQRVGSSDCQWLWNNPTAVHSKWLRSRVGDTCGGVAVPATISIGSSYVPVNAVDATSPWDRVLLSNPDYDCGTCFCPGCSGTQISNPRRHYRCGNIIYYSAGVLYIAESGAPAGSPPIYSGSLPGGGHWYWVFEFKAYGNIAWSYNSDSKLTIDAMSGAGTAGIDNTNNEPNFGGHVVGGRALDNGDQESLVLLQYAKEIDCSTDFEGLPVTIPFDRNFNTPPGRSFTMDTYPASVSIELTPA